MKVNDINRAISGQITAIVQDVQAALVKARSQGIFSADDQTLAKLLSIVKDTADSTYNRSSRSIDKLLKDV